MAAARTKLQADINGKPVMIKAEVQHQLNELKASIGDALKTMKGQVAEVQKSQDKMWGAISRMGEELRELATREDSSDEEQEAGPEVSLEETAPIWIPCVAPEAPRTVTSPIPPFGIPPKAPAVSFGTLDDASVRDSINSTVPQQSTAPKQERWIPVEDLLARKATADDTLAWATGMRVGASDHATELFCILYGCVLGLYFDKLHFEVLNVCITECFIIYVVVMSRIL